MNIVLALLIAFGGVAGPLGASCGMPFESGIRAAGSHVCCGPDCSCEVRAPERASSAVMGENVQTAAPAAIHTITHAAAAHATFLLPAFAPAQFTGPPLYIRHSVLRF